MNLNKYSFILLLLFVPVFCSAQSEALQYLEDQYNQNNFKYFYESVVRKAAQIASGEQGIELSKGIERIVLADPKLKENQEEVYDTLYKLLKEENYELYFEVGNMQQLSGLSRFLPSIGGLFDGSSKEQEAQETQEAENTESEEFDREIIQEEKSKIQEVDNKMALFGKGKDRQINSICLLTIEENSLKLTELKGQIKLGSIPDLIKKINKLSDIVTDGVMNQ